MKIPPLWSAFATTDNKSWSFARTSTGSLLAATIFWGTYIVWYEHKIPDFTSVALLFGAIYGINRGAEAYENRAPSAPTTMNINPEAPSTTVVNP
jgi:hypothetical protein